MTKRFSVAESATTAMMLAVLACLPALGPTSPAEAQVLDKQGLLEAQTFWDNRDWDWYRANIPFFECPDAEINTTWYYRWELITKHLTYGSPQSGYSFTEFIDRPFWSGAYGAISCPAGHQIYEVRWLRDPTYARDYARYWFRTPGAQPRNYSTWLADSVWALHAVHPDEPFTTDLLPDLVKNYEAWARRQFVPQAGLFWQSGHDDGMEYNINSRQTEDILRGDRGYRPSFNAYMWADAVAIAKIAEKAGDAATAAAYREKAGSLKRALQRKLWDPKREFFFPMAARQERDKEGNVVQANTLTYQSGKYAGSPHGREQIGYVPWQFNMPDAGKGYEAAWRFLMDPRYFYAARGPTTVERNDPQFALKKWCCWWSGQSWPYATTQTLKSMANLLHNYEQEHVSRADYVRLLRTYAISHRKDGRPYLAEALHPDTGSFEGHDAHNHSEHYFHSGFCDLVVTGLVGLRAEHGEELTVDPLAPADWEYFALDDLPFRGHRLAILWDRDGTRYGLGSGLHVLAGGKKLASASRLEKLTVELPIAPATPPPAVPRMNYAVNNDGDYYPRMTASYVAPRTSLSKVNDGNYWYHQDPPNRWTAAGSTRTSDWLELDLGRERLVDTVKLYFLDDGSKVTAPARFTLEFWDGSGWKHVPDQTRTPERPRGHRPSVVSFPAMKVRKLRTTFTHAGDGHAGLTELEVWGDGRRPYVAPPPPAGNLAYNPKPDGFPRASASHSDRFGGTPEKAIDGKVNFLPTPVNRWTSYESPNGSDWLEVDFGREITTSRVELAIYDDRGGVQAPKEYAIEFWDGQSWKRAEQQVRTPEVPAGVQVNEVRFAPLRTTRLRVVFTHADKSRSGVSEVFVWSD